MGNSKDPHLLAMPGASREYMDAREKLRVAERELTEQREAVAALRRGLPRGPTVQDYEFEDVRGGSVRLSQLFSDGKPELALYHLMYWADDDEFCPMCSLWIDGWDGIAHHVAQRANIAVVTRAPVDKLQAWAELRGWHRLRLLSDHGAAFAQDTGAEDEDGRPDSTVLVFSKNGSEVRHVYTGHPYMNGKERNIDLLCPVWHIFDLLPSGRGDWSASNALV
jgi:predicted dithiol-disulfide oxidoreductase (DUF899 family)